jgi:hypothetical protein
MRLAEHRNETGKRVRQAIEEIVHRDTDCRCLFETQPFLKEGTVEN